MAPRAKFTVTPRVIALLLVTVGVLGYLIRLLPIEDPAAAGPESSQPAAVEPHPIPGWPAASTSAPTTARPAASTSAPTTTPPSSMLSVDSYISVVEIVNEMEHQTSAFTQGLAFDSNGSLYESDGLFGQSAVRRVDIMSGDSLIRTSNDNSVFGEGLVVLEQAGKDARLLQLSWKNRQIFEYSIPDLELVRTVSTNIGKEGWGLTTDGDVLYITDSGHELFVVEPDTYKVIKTMPIIDPLLSNKPIYGVNELEWVHNEIWGNVYPMYQQKASECVVRIDPANGHVKGWVDMRGLLQQQPTKIRSQPMNNVLNGIAYHARSDRMFVTGKRWAKMYQIRVRTATAGVGPAQVPSVCQLG